MSFGKNMRLKRLERKLSQSELSHITHIPQTTISDLERGRYLPDIDKAYEIAKALDVPLTGLLEKTETA